MGSKRIVIYIVMLIAILAVAAVLYNVSRRDGPTGAATGGAAGCGGAPVDDPALLAESMEESEQPAHIVYEQIVDGTPAVRLTVEPMDKIASIEDLTEPTAQPTIVTLDDATVALVLDGYLELKDTVCTEALCPPGLRLEILTMTEDTKLLPYASPLKDTFEDLLTNGATAEGTEPTATEEPKEEPQEEPAEEAPEPFEVTLTPESGLVLEGAEVISPAASMKVDLICYNSNTTVDLKPGAGPTPVDERPMKYFRTPGGTVATFDDLAEVPGDIPTADDRDMVHNAKVGAAFAIQGNVSSGYATCWITDAAKGTVTLSCVWHPEE